MSFKKLKFNNGFASILAVIILGAVGVSIVSSVILFGLGFSRNSFSLEQYYQSKSLASACSEEALQQIKDSNFIGNGNLVLGQGSCDYFILDKGGEVREINSYGTVGSVIRKIQIEVDQINPTINIISWRDVSDF